MLLGDAEEPPPCPVHQISRGVRNVLLQNKFPMIHSVVSSLFRLIRELRGPTVNERALHLAQSLGGDVPVVILKPNETRWRGIFLCLERVMRLEDEIISVFENVHHGILKECGAAVNYQDEFSEFVIEVCTNKIVFTYLLHNLFYLIIILFYI